MTGPVCRPSSLPNSVCFRAFEVLAMVMAPFPREMVAFTVPLMRAKQLLQQVAALLKRRC